MLRDLLSDLHYRLRALFRRGDAERDLDEELHFHLEREAEKYVRQGLAPDAARRKARLAFGGVEEIKEDARDARGVRWLEILVQDLRTATRTLSAEPTFTAIAVGSLAVGISMGVATATMVAGVRSRVLPFPTANRAVVFYTGDRPTNFGPSWSISTEALRALGARGDRVTAVGARLLAIGTLATMPGPRSPPATSSHRPSPQSSASGPLLGRSFGPADADPHAPGVLMLEQRFWIAKFGGDTSIIGRPLLLNGKTYTVIGIYPQDQQLDQRTAFLAAKSLTSMIADSQTTVLGMALLAPGATVAGVNAELSAIVRRDASHKSPVRQPAGFGNTWPRICGARSCS